MGGRCRSISSDGYIPLTTGWSLCCVPPGTVREPTYWDEVSDHNWIACDKGGTVAAALRSAGRWSLDNPPLRFDAKDWWFRLRFDVPPTARPHALTFGGLAGLAEVWLNGEPLLTSNNMFISHWCATPRLSTTGNEIFIRFASLDAWLTQRRPRPRWRAPVVENQSLRWIRSTLLGRMPGWTPPAAPIGPWRSVCLIECGPVELSDLRLCSHVEDGNGIVTLAMTVHQVSASAHFELERNGIVYRAKIMDGQTTLIVPDVALWWPHTHGEPSLYQARIILHPRGGSEAIAVDLGAIGFRSINLNTSDGDFALRINNIPVFCRGACWMPLDVASLHSTPQACRAVLERVRDAGMNMLRITGNTVYEEDHFYDLCDELGILVWQDFMFANMDYPFEDHSFSASVRDEVVQQLKRWQARPSFAVLCGNSEVEQQAAMWGTPREHWAQSGFDHEIADLAHTWCPDVPYWPSSAHGGAFPHQNNEGTTSYYGVGAYLRPLEDARFSGLRFASECLAFANVPPDSTIQRMPGGHGLRVHSPEWKARSPRDLGVGWDFDDVRDNYLHRLYRVDPLTLRSSDYERYLALSRAVSAEVMKSTFSEWRRGQSSCRGALVWYLSDLWPGAGWGVLDDLGVPKAAFHGIKQACAPVSIFISDEGTNGLEIYVVNEPNCEIAVKIEVALYREDGLLMHRNERSHVIAGRGMLTLNAVACLEGFVDLSYAYRFGPPEYELLVATLRDADDAQLSQAVYFPNGFSNRRERDIGLEANMTRDEDGILTVSLKTQQFAQSVNFDVPGFIAQDEYFHLVPGSERKVRLIPKNPEIQPLPGGFVFTLNSWTATVIKVEVNGI
jgi:beta-mannosidase